MSTDQIFSQIESRAHDSAFGFGKTPPTENQCNAGNYKVGRVNAFGLSIAIEQPRNSYRTGIDASGKRWSSRMTSHYGYIEGTKGADGDAIDCFIGPFPNASYAYVINQNNPKGVFDEHKLMLGFPTQEMAEKAYLLSYAPGWQGMGSVIPLTIKQLKFLIDNFEFTQPISLQNLPYSGEHMKKIYWTPDATPQNGLTLDRVLYDIRRSDMGGLIFDSISIKDIMDDSDGVLIFDALVSPLNKIEPKMNLLKAVMERSSTDILKVLGFQVSEPFSQRGTANVAAVFELSDGQTVSVYFHNPDVTPKKIASNDELISYKWMLNKKDITIVVAPEQGKDLNIREVARRIMKLADKNSAAFQRANEKRAQSLAEIITLEASVASLESVLNQKIKELELLEFEYQDWQGKPNTGKNGDKTSEPGNIENHKDPINEETISLFGSTYTVLNPDSIDPRDMFLKALSEANGDHFEAAKSFFKEKLRGKFVKTVIGNVFLTGKTIEKMRRGMKSDELKARLIMNVPEILSAGKYQGKTEIYKDRDDFIAFHFFEKEVSIDDLVITAGISVGERSDKQLEYSLKYTGYGLNHSEDVRWKKREALGTAGLEPASYASPDGDSATTLDSILQDDIDEVNIYILKVVKKDTGERVPELEDVIDTRNEKEPHEDNQRDDDSIYEVYAKKYLNDNYGGKYAVIAEDKEGKKTVMLKDTELAAKRLANQMINDSLYRTVSRRDIYGLSHSEAVDLVKMLGVKMKNISSPISGMLDTGKYYSIGDRKKVRFNGVHPNKQGDPIVSFSEIIGNHTVSGFDLSIQEVLDMHRSGQIIEYQYADAEAEDSALAKLKTIYTESASQLEKILDLGAYASIDWESVEHVKNTLNDAFVAFSDEVSRVSDAAKDIEESINLSDSGLDALDKVKSEYYLVTNRREELYAVLNKVLKEYNKKAFEKLTLSDSSSLDDIVRFYSLKNNTNWDESTVQKNVNMYMTKDYWKVIELVQHKNNVTSRQIFEHISNTTLGASYEEIKQAVFRWAGVNDETASDRPKSDFELEAERRAQADLVRQAEAKAIEGARLEKLAAAVDAFTSLGFDNKNMAKALNHMETSVNLAGTTYTWKSLIDEKIGEGWRPESSDEPRYKDVSRTRWNNMSLSEQQSHEDKMRDGGNITVYGLYEPNTGRGFKLSKTAYQYALHQFNKKLSATDEPMPNVDILEVESASTEIKEPVNSPDIDFLNKVIKGEVDLLSEAVGDKLLSIGETGLGDVFVSELLNQAITIYQKAMLEATSTI